MPDSGFCGTTSIFLALSGPNSHFNASGSLEPTTPLLTQPDPQASLLRIIVPSVLIPVALLSLFAGRRFFSVFFCIFGTGVGALVAFAILYGRPEFVPIPTSCDLQWGSTAGGAAAGLLLSLFIIFCVKKVTSFFIGTALTFAVYQQYPQLDGYASGFPGEEISGVFLGWSYIFWIVLGCTSLTTFLVFFFYEVSYWREVFFISVLSSWGIAQSVSLVTRNESTFEQGISIAVSVVIFAGAFAAFTILQPLVDKFIFKERISKLFGRRDQVDQINPILP